MTVQVDQLSAVARQAVQSGNWPQVNACARQILAIDKRNAEGLFLLGLFQKASGNSTDAARSFERAIKSDQRRYDAAIELAGQHVTMTRHKEALDLLRRYEDKLSNSPIYLDMAAGIYTRLGLHTSAWPLLERANNLQPGVGMLEANLAACAVVLGQTEKATNLYRALIERNPEHQRNHYELSRLERATSDEHVEQMKSILASTNQPPERNIYLYYALGKELEDLERWDEAFDYYERGGDAVTRLAPQYNVDDDIALIDTAIEIATTDWLSAGTDRPKTATPIFVVGLPRSGTTLTERIIASHSQVESADETFFMQLALSKVSRVRSNQPMSSEIMHAAAKRPPDELATAFIEMIDYKLDGKAYFVEKLPENFLYLGFIARSFPEARIVLLDRNPMDSCFALYKQSFFKYAYSLSNVGRYYVAFDRLRNHWRTVLGDRLIEVRYEQLVAEQEAETRRLLDRLGLPFEAACLDFDQNDAPSATASATQVREKIHSRSVANWKHFSEHLQPLREILESAEIPVE